MQDNHRPNMTCIHSIVHTQGCQRVNNDSTIMGFPRIALASLEFHDHFFSKIIYLGRVWLLICKQNYLHNPVSGRVTRIGNRSHKSEFLFLHGHVIFVPTAGFPSGLECLICIRIAPLLYFHSPQIPHESVPQVIHNHLRIPLHLYGWLTTWWRYYYQQDSTWLRIVVFT